MKSLRFSGAILDPHVLLLPLPTGTMDDVLEVEVIVESVVGGVGVVREGRRLFVDYESENSNDDSDDHDSNNNESNNDNSNDVSHIDNDDVGSCDLIASMICASDNISIHLICDMEYGVWNYNITSKGV